MKFSRVIQTTNVIIIKKKIKRKLYANIIESAIYMCTGCYKKKIFIFYKMFNDPMGQNIDVCKKNTIRVHSINPE